MRQLVRVITGLGSVPRPRLLWDLVPAGMPVGTGVRLMCHVVADVGPGTGWACPRPMLASPFGPVGELHGADSSFMSYSISRSCCTLWGSLSSRPVKCEVMLEASTTWFSWWQANRYPHRYTQSHKPIGSSSTTTTARMHC